MTTSLMQCMPLPWREVLAAALSRPSFAELELFLKAERAHHQIFPPAPEVFSAFALTPPAQVRVVLLGQDPYHDDNQAHGLCFSVRPPTPPPPSLRNIFRELEHDLGIAPPHHGDLTPWARQGVFLLNTVLTVRAHAPASHQRRGWEEFTDAVIAAVSDHQAHVVFCLWGNMAKKKRALINTTKHSVVESAHPSPLSARFFLGTRPFSAINRALVAHNQTPIDWRIHV